MCDRQPPRIKYVRPSEVFIRTDKRNLMGSEVVLHPPIVRSNAVANHPQGFEPLTCQSLLQPDSC